MRKDWKYTGDVNLTSGGTFYQLPAELDDDSAMIRVVEVTPVGSAVGGPDCVFLIESGYAYLRRKDWPAALDCCGWKLQTVEGVEGIAIGCNDWHALDTGAGVALLQDAIRAYKGIEDPDREVIQIGKLTEYDPGYTLTPDTFLRGNAKLSRYVERVWL